MITKKIPSVIPYYITGVFWLLYAVLFPMYRISDFAIVTALSVFLFFLSKKVLPGKEITVEKPLEKTGDEELDAIIMHVLESIKQMRTLNVSIKGETISCQIDELVTIHG